MNNFFYPSNGLNASSTTVASEMDSISEVVIRPNAPARVGLFGIGAVLKPLALKIYRAGVIVSDGANAKVKFSRSSVDSSNRIQTFMVYGLIQNDELKGVSSDGSVVVQAIRVRVDQHGANSRIREWADQWVANDGFFVPSDHSLCVQAIPYLAMKNKKGQKMTELLEDNIGGPLVRVHGLSLHCTGESGGAAFDVANGHCVSTWNGNIAKFKTSAHFALAIDGTLMQIVPCDRVAYAQGDPGDQYWLSVEISNNGKELPTSAQISKLKTLFQWVCNHYNIPRQIASGRLVPNQVLLNAKTETIVSDDWAELVTSSAAATMSKGLSCHLWLDGRNGKPCPGLGILTQMPMISA
jgi:hypothetical protein